MSGSNAFKRRQSLTGAANVYTNASRATASAPNNPPYEGEPEDFATFIDIPLWPYQRFVTEPDFHPPVLEITKKPGATDGLLVFAPLPFLPSYPDRFAGGLIMDQLGNPIWHSPLQAMGNLEVTAVGVKYWTGGIGGNFIDAHGFGTVTILDRNYTQDIVYSLNDGTFNLIYEIDRATNKTVFRWSSVEHLEELPLNASYQLNRDGTIIDGGNATHPWDYFLTNAVTQMVTDTSSHLATTGGDFMLVDQDINPSTFSWQHFVRAQTGSTADGHLTITMFNNNNGGLDNGTAPSTGLELQLNVANKTAKTTRRLIDPNDQLYALSQGSYEALPNNHTFLAYGQIPKFKEFDAQGNVVMDARFGNDNQISSYRSSPIDVSAWSAMPSYPPRVARTQLGNGTVVLSMSWNGATSDVYDGWVVNATLTGGGARELRAGRTGSESNVTLPDGATDVVVRAAKGRRVVSRVARLV
ncbi:MAG: hypothetical protein Q9188_005342 [Gyalolechia gomerana]